MNFIDYSGIWGSGLALGVMAGMCLATSANSQTAGAKPEPFETFLISVDMPPAGIRYGAGEAHPAIRLKSGDVCDLTTIICLAKAEDDFGPSVFEARDRMIRGLISARREWLKKRGAQ